LKKNDKIFLAGHKGLAGSAILAELKKNNYKNIITVTKKELDLLDQKKVYNFLKKKKPNYVIIAAALAGGIIVNSLNKGKFLYENMTIQNNIIHGSYLSGTKNLLFLGSSCIYPKKAKQPFKESSILTGSLEKTNEGYALAKISGIKLCQYYNLEYGLNYLSLMPCNLYGPNDTYDLKKSHFIPAIINKIYDAKLKKIKEITLMGTGKAKREIMYNEDLGKACIFFLKKKPSEFLINIGTGKDYSIKYYAEFIRDRIYKKLKIKFDGNKDMDGTARKINSITIAKKYGWKASVSFNEGLKKTYSNYLTKL